ncbi:uncharacterized protein LOC118234127 isoform X4 [Anguilla anguilla]|uniref:uncharacterized protein LOC118234127 isoform X4 n=1 Tax=Anguilla anguilla TaxID=7936 RepID=UPI0015AAB1F8|nr:uncharacterized protein LOC118234127 isoform X4 [Anguilla anguilla]
MGGGYSVTVKNKTPYTWHYSDEERGRLSAWESKQFKEGVFNESKLYLTYGDQREVSLSLHTGGGRDTTFTIKESWDRSLFELHCSVCGEVRTCPNYAKIEEDRIRQQQQEEQRRQEALKRQQEEQRRQEALKRQQEEQRRQEALKRQQEEQRRQEALKRLQEEQKRQEALKRQQEEQKRQEALKRQQEEQKRWEALKRQQEEQKLWEALKRLLEEHKRQKEEQKRQEALKRQQEEQRRQEALKRQQEEQRRQEALKRQQEEQRRQEALKRQQEEQRRQEALKRQQEEQRRQEALKRLQEEQKRQEALKRQQEEQKRQEALKRQQEEQKRWEALKRQQEEQKLREALKRLLEEHKRQKEEQKRQEALKRQQEEQKRQEALKRQQEEQKRWEALKRLLQEQKRQQEEQKRQEALKRQQEEQKRQEALKRQQEEQKRNEELRRQEELRRLERLEQEKRIEEQINRENETARRKLSEAWSKINLNLGQGGQERHHQHTHVVQQAVDDHAGAIEWDESTEIEKRFNGLLLENQIIENKRLTNAPLEDRMRNLQTELTVQFCQEQGLSSWPVLNLEAALQCTKLSLTERFSLLKAMTQVQLEDNQEGSQNMDYLNWDKNYSLFLFLMEKLSDVNNTLASKLMLAFLDLFPDLSQISKNHLSQILFSGIWTTVEIMFFLRGVSSRMNQNTTESVLHKVQTYRLGLLLTLSALRDKNQCETLQGIVEGETDKDIDSILSEMQDANYPDKFVSVIEQVLRQVAEELTEYPAAHLWKNVSVAKKIQKKIGDVEHNIKLLSFRIDISTLKDVLIGISMAVKECSTLETQGGEKIEGYLPRITQLASLLMLLLQSTEDKGCLLEIGTGEGKSCILAMFAVIQAIRGAKVDIVTSSPVLARRDQGEWRKLYDMFGVSSSVVPPPLSASESHEKRLKDAYLNQIVYGTVSDFAADTLRQEFERQISRGEREFDLVIVDEVDYMTLDSGVQVTFLSHEASGMRHVEQVLASIWSMLCPCRPIEMEETGEMEWITGIQHFHEAAKMAVMGPEASEHFSDFDILLPGIQLGFYTQDDINQLIQSKTEVQKEGKANDFPDDNWKATETFMTNIGVEEQHDLLCILETALEQTVSINCYRATNNKAALLHNKKMDRDMNIKMLLLENGQASEIMSEKSLIEASVQELKSKIKYSDACTPNSKDTESFMVIPSFLKQYLENRLPLFVGNALKAIAMTQGREYMIDVSSSASMPSKVSESDRHFYHSIIPVDYQASGVLEKNKRWGDGLQQFLEMKHQLAISPLSIVTNYMSNMQFFKRYLNGRGIFGVSGTLGGDPDKDFLKRHYKTDSYVIPAHRYNKVVELPTQQISGDYSDWVKAVRETTWAAADRGQVVLVVCEDVKTAVELQKEVESECRSITMYTISERDYIEETTFKKGNIIIATNLGGRGTDIKVNDEVNQCGGLFVLLTHFPSNRRVEKQVFGRTARKGNPGMVQMILHLDQLAPAYQGQPVEVMRQLREDYEVQRISDMESNELLENEMKEKLFATFCKFLKEFDANYTEQERENLLSMKTNNVVDTIKHQGNKLDYKPALNALKESWALWLTLNENNIKQQKNFSELEADLFGKLTSTSSMLLQGQSHKFYDSLKQAVIRTDLHCHTKTKCDYGAKDCWQKVAECDPFYRAVALYNQAYITINLAKKGYKAEAIKLLEESKETVDVYISETSNTAVAGQMAMRGNFEPHHDGACNFQSQMQARMDIFKTWRECIDNALEELKEIERSNSDAITEETSVYSLSDEKDFVTTNELMAMYEYGLGIVFDIKQKPRFNVAAFICFLLGATQVLAGVLVCSAFFGSASQFGLGLISEGVYDMISGVEGMKTGVFNWASWAISKSISIGISLLTAGFGTIKSVCSTTKDLLNGTKTLSSVAQGVIKSGKATLLSMKGAAMSAVSSVSRSSLRMGTDVVVKQTFKQACRFAGQEIVKQSTTYALHYAVDAGLTAALKDIVDSVFRKSFKDEIKRNGDLNHTLTHFICLYVPKSAPMRQHMDFKIDKHCERKMKKMVKFMAKGVLPSVMTDYTTVHKIIDGLSNMSEIATVLLDKAHRKYQAAMNVGLVIAKHRTMLKEMLESVPTRTVVNEKIVPKLIQQLNEQLVESYAHDDRHDLPDVKRLKGELLELISDTMYQAFSEACATHTTTFMKGIFQKKISQAAEGIGNASSNIFGRHKTLDFFQEQQQRYNMKSAGKILTENLSEAETQDLQRYISNISSTNHPASELDLYVLTKSDLLQGKGIKVIMFNKDGQPIYENTYPGNDNSAGFITLKLSRKPDDSKSQRGFFRRMADRVQGVQHPHEGHYSIIHPDGSDIPVISNGQGCLYHAVIQATTTDQEPDIQQRAALLRNDVQSELNQNLPRYAGLVRLQKRYEQWQKTPGQYAVIGGGLKRQKTDNKINDEDYKNTISVMKAHEYSPGASEYDISVKYYLGYVGTYEDLKNTIECGRKIVEKDHFIPTDTFAKARENEEALNELQNSQRTERSELYNLVTEKDKNDHLAMQVLYQDHRNALTTGNSKGAQKCRALLADTLLRGDGETLLKQAMIMANPISSQKLKRQAGIQICSFQGGLRSLTEEGTNCYYKTGYMKLISEYQKMGIIDQNAEGRLKTWVKENQHLSKNTPEYDQILQRLKPLGT